MPTVISNEELQVIALLEQNTGAHAKDAILTDDSIIYVVQQGELGKAIGKQGQNIAKMKKITDKKVEVVEAAEDINAFVKNLFTPVEIKAMNVQDREGKKVIVLEVDPANKGLAIGKGGEKIKRARMLVKRLFEYDDLKIL
ncbi:MAG TPA: NusA-like transcription termination signal-binding factor [Candidatus Norongarragalinales archaeon]|jgi:N utilization substance protein A|nr:NusA-like transcription termination signal-binding factor [Candidatus Norongarragalinales archaeon]